MSRYPKRYTTHTTLNDDAARYTYHLFWQLNPLARNALLTSLNLIRQDERSLPHKEQCQRGLVRAAKFGLFPELVRLTRLTLKNSPAR